MNINHLEAFCTVAQVKSISEAARILHMSQSSLSYQIQLLEKDLDVELFTRTTKGVELTEMGEIVYEYGQTFLQLAENLRRDLDNWKSGQEHLIVGASSSIGSYALPCTIYSFKEKYPDANVKLLVGNREETIQKLLDKTIDIGLIEGPVDQPGLATRGVTEDELLLIVPAGWQGQESITLEELCRLPLILREEGSGTRQVIARALAEHGLGIANLNVVLELNSNDAIKSAITAGHGVSLLSRLATRREIHNGSLKALQVKGISFRSTFTIVYPAGKPATNLQKKFFRFLLANKKAFC
ncbi:selenium metabolism-associated LysR family transcriptional regulator [Neomoorella thermoacetica]|uniref:HTH-type transcriptional activator CmpR n=2 Tax=Neomoorella thermoacetica TaxID=1525 RepID=A0AAC9MTV1_NEOTH|nr:selenium metabolism-associated LysR family transcriptional regulator [Moorella thermoacetica]AKX95839.1 HTH-type transcriptional activator CmpR [Moorella thermoacetica]AOQ22861.1 HTH-type transcriptional activator CmpR [Moorella thermoacetica]OIQ53834.1 HTH-type transcriptional activator CmpR [Moorella thermoacetica]OIQ55926.1 HTH-type transcriptional activator CmpR [Moorella thermoacetica]QCZ99653.1 HTH-type transcriptional activator CmpR [Moorella thermoacetica]